MRRCVAHKFRFLCQGQGRNQVRGQNRVSAITQKLLNRKIEHIEKVCYAQEIGSCAKGQDHNQVRGQVKPKIPLLINYKPKSKYDDTSQKDKG